MATSRYTILLTFLLPLLSSAQLGPRQRWRASHEFALDFGSCPDPGITWDYDLDGSEQYGFAPTNQTQFPHGFSSDVSTLEVYICNRLKSVCNASPRAVGACRNAFELYSGLSGQNAADSWNEALGLYGGVPSSAPSSTNYATTTTAMATVLVSGASVPYSTLFSAVSTAYSESQSISALSSYVSPTYTVYSTETITHDLASTSTRITSPTRTSTSTVVLPVSVSTSSADVPTSIIVPTGGTTVTTTTSYGSTATAQPQSTGTESGDGGGSPFSGAKARRLELKFAMIVIALPAVLNIFLRVEARGALL